MCNGPYYTLAGADADMAGHSKVLNPKQILFAQAVASGKAFTEAYRLAGYISKHMNTHASELAAEPLVAAEIERLEALEYEVKQIGADWWRREIVYQYKKVREATNATDALRALEIIGKHLDIIGGGGDQDVYDRAALLMSNATALMALQMAAQAAAKGPAVKTVDAVVRKTLGLPADDA